MNRANSIYGVDYAEQTDDSCSELDSLRFHHDTQNRTQFKTYKLLISGMFSLNISIHNWLQVTETTKSEITDKEGLLYFILPPGKLLFLP